MAFRSMGSSHTMTESRIPSLLTPSRMDASNARHNVGYLDHIARFWSLRFYLVLCRRSSHDALRDYTDQHHRSDYACCDHDGCRRVRDMLRRSGMEIAAVFLKRFPGGAT